AWTAAPRTERLSSARVAMSAGTAGAAAGPRSRSASATWFLTNRSSWPSPAMRDAIVSIGIAPTSEWSSAFSGLSRTGNRVLEAYAIRIRQLGSTPQADQATSPPPEAWNLEPEFPREAHGQTLF